MPEIIHPGRYTIEYGIQLIEAEFGGDFLRSNIDIDGNGFTDFLLAGGVFPPDPIISTSGDIIYQFADGFYLSSNAFSGTLHPREFAFGDFNGDSVTDIFVAAHGYDAPPFPGENSILAISSGREYIEPQPELTRADGFTHSAAAGDVDGDGDVDLLSVNITPDPGAVLFMNDGTGFLADRSDLLPVEIWHSDATFSATSSLIHDIDGDGSQDIILGSQSTRDWGASRIYFGNSYGSFVDSDRLNLLDRSINQGNQIILDIKSIDIDLDGDDDIVTSYTQLEPFYAGAGIQVFRNDGDRVFTDVSLEALGQYRFDGGENWVAFLEILDFNEDGVKDIYLDRAGASSESVLVFLGDGAGQFSPLLGKNIVTDGNFDFLLSNTLPSYRNGKLELAGAQYFQNDYIISRIVIDEPAIVELDPKIDGNFFVGTSSADNLIGTGDADVFIGGTGDDTVLGLGDNDRLVGDVGNDSLNGGQGADTLNGGDGNDTIIGGPADDDLRDVIYAGEGNDSVDAGAGNDLIYGQGGNDTIAGGFGVDEIQGQDGDDVITGSALSDLVFGGAGNDFVNGGFGHDRINGGSGADKFFHVGVEGHGSDWVQDYTVAEGDVLLFGNEMATRDQFQVNLAHTANSEGERSGDDAVQEAFVIYRPTGQIMWALVDGEGQDSINLKIGDEVFDLLG